jgi:hypothetical protein
VHHQVQKARNVGLEGAVFGFGVGSGRHGRSVSPAVSTRPEMARNVSKFKIICRVIDAVAAIAGGFRWLYEPLEANKLLVFHHISSCDLSHFNS